MDPVRRLLVAALLVAPLAAMEVRWTPGQRDAIAASLPRVADNDGTWMLETANYRVETELGREFTAKAACFMEGVRGEVTGILGLERIGLRRQVTRKAAVFIASSQERYQQRMGNGTGSRGWFRYAWDGNGVFTEFCLNSYALRQQDAFESFYVPILIHEGTHQVLQEFAGRNRIPDLLNEGIASYLQGFDLNRDLAWNTANRTSEYLRKLPLGIDAGSYLPLADIFDPQPWDVDGFGRQTNTRYVEAETLIAFLLSSRPGTVRLQGMLADACAGTLKPAVATRSLGRIEEDYRAYLFSHAARPAP
jgi:hypothetical protein